jgi:hypothetical protein
VETCISPLCGEMARSFIVKSNELLAEHFNLKCDVIVLVASFIGTGDNSALRYVQTLDTIESIDIIRRQARSGVRVILIEGSDVEYALLKSMLHKVDLIITLEPELRQYTAEKSLGEAYLTSLVVPYLNPSNFNTFIKLSGRYTFNSNFNLVGLRSYKKCCFRHFVCAHAEWYGTMVYLIPSSYFDDFVFAVTKTYSYILLHNTNYETSMYRLLSRDVVERVELIGAEGLCAGDGQVHYH